MGDDVELHRVQRGADVDLRAWPTRFATKLPAARIDRHLERERRDLERLQTLLYAQGRHSLLVVLQAMDAAGKDSAIKHVLAGVNPQGVQVTSFKHPGPEALAHDFLWRAMQHLPEHGRIAIFNRSHYEEVVTVRVHPDLLTAERLPDEARAAGHFWRDRHRSIRDFERHLVRNGTAVVKLFLHVSKEEQRRRLLARLDEPEKFWKWNAADLDERDLWDEYMQAYAGCLSATSTKEAPWYVVPADDKDLAHLAISRVLVRTLKGLKMSYPKPKAKSKELAAMRRRLEAE